MRSRPTSEYMSASGGQTAPTPVSKLAAKRKVYEADCSKPVDFDQGQGNLRCN